MKKESILNLFSADIRDILARAIGDFDNLMEIRLRSGQPLLFVLKGKEYYIDPAGRRQPSDTAGIQSLAKGFRLTQKEIQETLSYISKYSLYAFEDEIRQGYITVSGGHRVGICGKAVVEEGRIKTIRCISFINIRIAHEVLHCSDVVMPYLYDNGGDICNTLIISPPMCGKTTLLRDMVRNISNGFGGQAGMKVGLVDERSEIAASYRGIPQNDVGIRTDVMDAMPKTEGMMMLIRTMSPNVIAVDEVGSKEELAALHYGMYCGCRLLGTVHGHSLKELDKKPCWQTVLEEGLFKRFIVLWQTGNDQRLAEVYDGERKRLTVESVSFRENVLAIQQDI